MRNKYLYKIYVQDESMSSSMWEEFITTIFEYSRQFSLEIQFDTNEVHFFLESKKDLSNLSSKILPFILQPHAKDEEKMLASSKSCSVKISGGKDLLAFKEHERVKNGRDLKRCRWDFVRFVTLKFCTVKFWFKNTENEPYTATKYFVTIPYFLLALDFSKFVKYTKKSIPSYLKIEEVSHLFEEHTSDPLLEVSGFPYFNTQPFLPLRNFDFAKHSLIVGQTGVGKSKFIEHFIRKIRKENKEDEYAVILIDPHATIGNNFKEDIYTVDFQKSACELFPTNTEPKIATELTILLFKTLLEDQFNAKMERVLKYTLFVLFQTQNMSLISLKKFLTEIEFRKTFLKQMNEYEHIVMFFDTEFVELQTKFFEIAVMPILVLIDELSFLTIFNNKSFPSLIDIVEHNFLTSFSLNRIFLGEKATKLVAGLIIQEIFLLAQSRSFSKKIILIIDEVSSVENQAFISILSEARKFDLSLVLAEQYLSQTDPAILKAILSNVYNYYVFKIAEEDAKIISKNVEINFADEVLRLKKEKGENEDTLKVKLLTTLNPRETLVRVFQNGKFYPAFKSIVPKL